MIRKTSGRHIAKLDYGVTRMGYLEAIYAIWLREFKVYTRERERAISSLVTPLIWLFAFGAGLGASISVAGGSYQQFIFPGILAMNVLFTSMFYGMYIVWDKKMDLLKEMLIAPVPRWVVFIGKALGGLTNALVQVLLLLIISGLFMGIHLTPGIVLLALLYAALFGFFCVSLGLGVGAILSSPDSFSLVMSFVLWPMFLTSGALYPIANLPAYLQGVVMLNPMAYGVDLLRGTVLGSWNFGAGMDLGILIIYAVLVFIAGQKLFERMSLG